MKINTVDTKLLRSILNGKFCPSDMNEMLLNLLDEFDHAEQRIEELEQERRWIPVSTLPEKTGYYIISWQNYIHDSKLNSDYGFYKVGEGWNTSSIKYWQPFPQPPQEEE